MVADFATNLLKDAAVQTRGQAAEDDIDEALNPPEEFSMHFHNFVNLFDDGDATKNGFG